METKKPQRELGRRTSFCFSRRLPGSAKVDSVFFFWLLSALACRRGKQEKKLLSFFVLFDSPSSCPDNSTPATLFLRSTALPACRSQFRGKGEIEKRVKRYERAPGFANGAVFLAVERKERRQQQASQRKDDANEARVRDGGGARAASLSLAGGQKSFSCHRAERPGKMRAWE